MVCAAVYANNLSAVPLHVVAFGSPASPEVALSLHVPFPLISSEAFFQFAAVVQLSATSHCIKRISPRIVLAPEFDAYATATFSTPAPPPLFAIIKLGLSKVPLPPITIRLSIVKFDPAETEVIRLFPSLLTVSFEYKII